MNEEEPLRDDAIWQALQHAFLSGDWSKYQGAQTEALRELLSHEHRRKFVYLCASGTIATEIALRGLGIRPGDGVALAAYDFPGNFRAIEAIGARPHLFDVQPSGWAASLDSIEQLPTSNIKSIIVSHLHGQFCDMAGIQAWATKHGISILEDACQGHGAILDEKPVGSFGDVSILSFGGSKLISAGRGGAVLTNDPYVDQRMRVFCDRGNDAFAMSELQAAVIPPQWKELSRLNELRWQAVQLLEKKLALLLADRPKSNRELIIPKRTSGTLPAFYKWGIQVRDSEQSAVIARAELIQRLNGFGISCGEGFRGFSQRSSHRCEKPVELPHSKQASESTILIHHTELLKPQHFQDLLVEELLTWL